MSNLGDYGSIGGPCWPDDSEISKNKRRPRKSDDTGITPQEESKRIKNEEATSKVAQENLTGESVPVPSLKSKKINKQQDDAAEKIVQGHKRERDGEEEVGDENALTKKPATIVYYVSVEQGSSQSWLIEPMQQLGYEMDQSGVCFGLSCMAVQAILADDIHTFTERLQKVRKLDFRAFTQETPEEQQTRADILAFFDGICLYQQPTQHVQFILQPNPRQKMTEIAKEMAPIDLVKKEGSIESLDKKCALIDKDSLKLYFEEFRNSFKNAAFPVALSLSSEDHEICVGYFPEPRDEWFFIDANYKTPLTTKDVDKLATKVFIALASYEDNITITVNSYVTQKNFKSAAASNQELQRKTAAIFAVDKENPLLQTELGIALLHQAIYADDVKLVSSLLEFIDANALNKNSITPLCSAADNGNIETVEILLNKNANPNQVVREITTPLLEAAQYGNVEIAKLLVNKGADVNLAPDQTTALRVAAANGYSELVNMLLEKDANPNIADDAGVTPLFAAACNGHIDIVKMLLNKQADPNLADESGMTPLQVAKENDHIEISKLLEGK